MVIQFYSDYETLLEVGDYRASNGVSNFTLDITHIHGRNKAQIWVVLDDRHYNHVDISKLTQGSLKAIVRSSTNRELIEVRLRLTSSSPLTLEGSAWVV